MSEPFRTVTFRGTTLRLPVYLDHHATTPLDPRVLEAMQPYFVERFGNPHSADHAYGWQANRAVEAARGEVALLVGALPEDVVFTSGATEANNLAIRGAAHGADERRHVITCVTEHPCVLEACRMLGREGFEVTELAVSADGLIDLERLRSALRPTTALISIMIANHEIGVIQPLGEIARLAHGAGALVHTDAAQAAGRIPIDVAALDVDLMSLSAHKMSGPKGVGALYFRRGTRIVPLFAGGGQERGLRPGTLPTPLCVGFGAACRIARAELEGERARLRGLRDRMHRGLAEGLDGVQLNGARAPRLPHNLNLRLTGVNARDLLDEVPDLALATGSACASASLEPSPVLRALGLDDEAIQSSVRIGLGRTTTELEVDYAIERIIEVARSL